MKNFSKKAFSVIFVPMILAVFMLLGAFSAFAATSGYCGENDVCISAQETTGTYGDNVSWTLDIDSLTLTVSGSGDMMDNPGGFIPGVWYYASSLVVSDGISSIGTCAFVGCENLLSVSLPVSLNAVNRDAFSGCSSLADVQYNGSPSQWSEVVVDYGNDSLLSANFVYAYDTPDDPSPVISIAVDDVILYEYNDGYYTKEYNPETECTDAEYFVYNIPNYHYTVTLNDASTVEGWADIPVRLNNEYYYPAIETNQSYINQWGIGEHTATATLFGKSADFKVTVLPCPIKKLVVSDIIRYENADGYMSAEWVWNEITGDEKEVNRYFRYEWDMEYRASAELFDGTVVTSQHNDYPHGGARGGDSPSFMINGVICRIGFEDDQSYENQWKVGEHSARATCCGASCEVKVVVAPTPVKSVLVDKITLIEGADGYREGEEFVYTLPEFIPFTVILQDGTKSEAVKEDKYNPYLVYINDKGYSIKYDGECVGRNWIAGQTYQIPATLCGKSFFIEVEIAENQYKSFSIEDNGDLYLVFERENGTEDRQRVLSFDIRAADENGLYTGILTTDKKQFSHASFYVDKPDDILEKGVGYYLQCTDNLRLEIGDLKSNILEKSHWLALQLSYNAIPLKIIMYSWYTQQINRNFTGFDGIVTDDNIDDIVTIAVNICDYFGCGDVGEDGYDYGIFDVDSVKKDVELLFGIKDIDLTKFFGYDEQNPQRVHVLSLNGGCGPAARTLTFENGKWSIEFTEYTDEKMTSIRDYVKVILSKDATIEKIGFSADAPCPHTNVEIRNFSAATCCKNGNTGDTYCLDCGEKTKNGTVIPATGIHADTDGKWESNAGQHWHTCSCGKQFDVNAHSGGTAICTKKATMSENGTLTTKCRTCGTVLKTQTVYAVKSVTLSGKKFTYTGKAIKPSVTVTDGSKKVISSSNYTVSYSDNVKVGTGRVTVKFKGNYSGSKTLTFTIAPKQVTGLKASDVKTTSLKLTWTKATGAKYYKVEQSTDGKTWKTVKTVSTNNLTISKLTAGKKYQFRVTALDSTKKIAGKTSSVLKTGTQTKAPAVTLKSAKSETATATWKKVTGASEYIVYKSTDGKKWVKVTTTTKLTYNLTKLSGGKKIYVKVYAVNACGKNSVASAVKSVTVKK